MAVRLGEDSKLCLLVVIGVREDGCKELLAIEDGYRESEDSWAAVFRDLRDRGMNEPKLMTGDGALGAWAAVRSVFPGTREQRCWVHKTANVLDALPKRLQPRAKTLLHEMAEAPTRADARKALERFRGEFDAKYPKAVAKLDTIICWWEHLGKARYPDTRRLTITADSGGSNNPRTRLWRYELQRLADRTGLEIRVCHFPPGTSKWNKIEHRMFSFVSLNWRGKPLETLEVIINLIAATKTGTGLKLYAQLDERAYERGLEITDEQLASVNITRHTFHGDWNYTITPSVITS